MQIKKLISAVALTLCAVTLTACSGANKVSFDANWYYDTTSNLITGNSEEKLTYAVTYDKSEGLYSEFYEMNYSDGVYETSLKTIEAEGEAIYEYTATLTLNVSFTLVKTGEVSETFTDQMSSVVRFKSVSGGLSPIYSKKTTVCHSPNGVKAAVLTDCYTYYHYDVETVYKNGKGTATITDYEKNFLKGNKDEATAYHTHNFKASGGDYTYLDNEQLLFALRGMPAASNKVTIHNPLIKANQTISVSTEKAKGGEFTFTLDGSDAKKAINYVPFSVSISSDNPGATQTVWIAKTEDPLKNTYRNVILRLETPIAYGAGSLVYELTSAEFAK